MLNTKVISDIHSIPVEWIFEHYLNLNVKLEGQEVRIKSIFNLKDKDPSMYLYFDRNYKQYKFKDFSTGQGGHELDFVMTYFSLEYGEAIRKIEKDYADYLENHEEETKRNLVIQEKFKVFGWEKRKWNQLDAKFWSQFHIDSNTLEFYRVSPLASYKMKTDDPQNPHEFIVSGNYIYGYFRLDGSLYKIYQPYSKKRKYIKVADYIQGTDQLEFNQPFLIIASGLKDISVLRRLNFNAEYVASDSENILIKPDMISAWRQKYENICTLFDNDEAGIRSMNRYKETYNIPFAHLKIENDIALASKAVGLTKLKEELYPLLKQALRK